MKSNSDSGVLGDGQTPHTETRSCKRAIEETYAFNDDTPEKLLSAWYEEHPHYIPDPAVDLRVFACKQGRTGRPKMVVDGFGRELSLRFYRLPAPHTYDGVWVLESRNGHRRIVRRNKLRRPFHNPLNGPDGGAQATSALYEWLGEGRFGSAPLGYILDDHVDNSQLSQDEILAHPIIERITGEDVSSDSDCSDGKVLKKKRKSNITRESSTLYSWNDELNSKVIELDTTAKVVVNQPQPAAQKSTVRNNDDVPEEDSIGLDTAETLQRSRQDCATFYFLVSDKAARLRSLGSCNNVMDFFTEVSKVAVLAGKQKEQPHVWCTLKWPNEDFDIHVTKDDADDFNALVDRVKKAPEGPDYKIEVRLQ